MQIQEATIESPEAEQVPEIPSPSADDHKSPEAKGRYGWVALLAVAAIAVGLLVVQVIASPEPSFEPDASYAVAEQNRFDALAGSSVSDELDPSYAEAEQNRFDARQNRFDALSESSGSDELDPSYAKAEQNRFDALTE